MNTISSKIDKLQKDNNNTLAGLYYKDFVNAVGEPNRYDSSGLYYLGDPNNSHNLRRGIVAQWGSIHDNYYIKIAFDPCTKKFITIDEEHWDYRWTNCNTNNNTKTNNNNEESEISVGKVFGIIIVCTLVILGFIA